MEKQNENSKIVLKSSFWYTVSNFMTRAMVFITTPIFTRLLTTEQFGNFHVFANWQSIFLIICGLEIYATVNRARFDYTDEESMNGYVSSCLVLSTVITGIVLLLYMIFPEYFERMLLMERKYVLIMFVYLFTYPAFEMFQVKQRIQYNYKLSSILSFGTVLMCSILALTLAHLVDSDRLYGRVIGQYMPVALLGAVLYIMFIVKGHTIKISYWKYAINLAIPLVLSYLAGQILLSSDKIVVQHLCSPEAVAYLGIATSCAHIMSIFVQCLNNAWSPWFYDKLNNKEYFQIRKVFRLYLWFILFCTFGVLMIGPEIVRILGGKSYLATLYLLPANMLTGIFNLIITQFGSLETFHKKAHYAAILTGVSAALNLILDYVFVNQFGYIAASYVTVACYIILIIMHSFVSRRFNSEQIFPMKDIRCAIMVALIMIPIVLCLYQNLILRWGILFFVGIFIVTIVIIKRQIIVDFIKRK